MNCRTQKLGNLGLLDSPQVIHKVSEKCNEFEQVKDDIESYLSTLDVPMVTVVPRVN